MNAPPAVLDKRPSDVGPTLQPRSFLFELTFLANPDLPRRANENLLEGELVELVVLHLVYLRRRSRPSRAIPFHSSFYPTRELKFHLHETVTLLLTVVVRMAVDERPHRRSTAVLTKP